MIGYFSAEELGWIGSDSRTWVWCQTARNCSAGFAINTGCTPFGAWGDQSILWACGCELLGTRYLQLAFKSETMYQLSNPLCFSEFSLAALEIGTDIHPPNDPSRATIDDTPTRGLHCATAQYSTISLHSPPRALRDPSLQISILSTHHCCLTILVIISQEYPLLESPRSKPSSERVFWVWWEFIQIYYLG